MKVKITDLQDLMIQLLKKNYSDTEAQSISEVLLYAELSGKNTQGLLKLMGGSEAAQNIKPKHPPKIIKETKLSALIDGGGANGPLVAQVATDKAISIAMEQGFAIVGSNNTFSSVGAISFYARKLAKNNLIGIVAAGSPKAILHDGGIDPLYGTNPIAFSFPTETHSITFDSASSAITWSGLVRAKALGQKLPENVAIDKNGNMTVDPDEAMSGALLPFDRSYKGSGIAMCIELLTGPLTGAQYIFEDGDWGTIFIAISPDLLVGVDEFKKHSSDFISKIKESRTMPGKKIHIPGFDKESQIDELMRLGEIEIEDKIIKALKGML